MDFARFRDHLNPASGFQSCQFRELEFLSGMKDSSLLKHLAHSPEEITRLQARLRESDLKDCLDGLLRRAGFPVSEPGGAGQGRGEETRSRARVEALLRVYGEPEVYPELYLLCESMIEYDENFILWRHRHILMVERMIGMKPGTGGTDGVGYLATTLGKRAFPELWEVRTRIGTGSRGDQAESAP